ncbi:DUF4835 family protein [Ornithobacterium rhinotracheale]|uniref:type IX secretion system protein PorD n=1 Tax=Ornithobacterium rhinotracheale TaxID=28251 RepID=UPI00129CE579|nr:DUF4835 family protein [Ornithobacterium rhinotracheale]MRI62942.1 DUF4835 family protein [Ornithobacterium rhinotracheale]
MKIKIATLLLLFLNFSFAQEFYAEVNVDYSQVGSSNASTYQALEKSLKDFINTTKWSDKNYKIHERIEASFNIIIKEKTGSNKYKASLQVQSRRPVFNTNYYTPTLNVNDTHFDFEYTDYQQIVFNQRKFSNSNLSDVIGFYVYLILGADADTFSNNGGTPYFKIAQNVSSNALSSRFEGWDTQSTRNRTALINKILSPSGSTMRTLYYNYHIRGLDQMYSNELNAKNNIGNALLTLSNYEKSNDFSQNYMLDVFFNTKKHEIEQIFSGGIASTFGLNKLKTLLDKISPNNNELWKKLNK